MRISSLVMTIIVILVGPAPLAAQAMFAPAQTTAGPFGMGSFRPDLDVGDFTGDCFPDVIWVEADFPISNFVTWTNDGTGGFPSHTVHLTEFGPCSVRLADVDGDGDCDVIAGTNGGAVVVFPNNGGTIGFFAPLWLSALGPRALRRLEVADVDLDGDVDFVVGPVLTAGSDHLSVFLNSGSGTFLQSDTLYPVGGLGPTPGPDGISDIVLDDVTGDGMVDVIVAHETGAGYPFNSSVSVYENLGGGQFDTGAAVYNGTSTTPAMGLAVADINDSGGNDIVVFTDQDIIRLYNQAPSSPLMPWQIQIPIQHPMVVWQVRFGLLHDLDRDGDEEIFCWGGDGIGGPGNPYEVTLHDGSGGGAFAPPVYFETGTGSSGRVADLDLDGWDDLLWFRNPLSKDITVALNTTGGLTTVAGLRGLASSVNSGPYTGTDKSYDAGDTISVGLDDLGDSCLTGNPATLFMNFPPESTITAVTPLTGGVAFPGMTLVTPFSVPSGPVAVVADSLGFSGPGINVIGSAPIFMGDPPLTVTAPVNAPGTVYRFQAVYYHPIPANFSTLGLVATNELRLTAN